MRNITKIFTLVLSLILLFAVSCSNDDKTGVPNNPPENDTEITDGETGSGGTGTGGSEEGGSEEGGSEEGGGGTETPPTPSDPEIVTEIDAKDFPADLLGYYTHPKTGHGYAEVKSIMEEGVKTTEILATFDNGTDKGARHSISIKKWKKTTKGGKIIKVEGEKDNDIHGYYTVTFDCESEPKTISGTFKHTGADWSFSGKKMW